MDLREKDGGSGGQRRPQATGVGRSIVPTIGHDPAMVTASGNRGAIERHSRSRGARTTGRFPSCRRRNARCPRSPSNQVASGEMITDPRGPVGGLTGLAAHHRRVERSRGAALGGFGAPRGGGVALRTCYRPLDCVIELAIEEATVSVTPLAAPRARRCSSPRRRPRR